MEKGCFKKFDKWKLILVIIVAVLLAGYMGGFLYILLGDANVDLNPIHCMAAGWTSTGGRMWILFSVLVLFFLTALVIYRGSENPLQDERGFELSDQGTYGTAGFMKEGEQAEILRADKTIDGVNGIIFWQGAWNRKGSKPSCRFQAKPEHCCLRLPGFYEIQGICKSHGITVRAPWGEHVHYGSQIRTL